MKRLFTNIIILIVIINVILSNFSNVLATTTYDQYMNEGTATVHPEGTGDQGVTLSLQEAEDDFNVVLAILLTVINVVPTIARGLVTIVANSENDNTLLSMEEFTIQNLIFGKYEICDINIFEDSSSGAVGTIKSSVNTWYMATRSLAIIFSLFILIYVGIRMAMSTLAADKAKYKKMLIDWVTSFALIFILHYIIIIAMTVSESLMGLFSEPAENLETTIVNNNFSLIWTGGKQLEISILFWLLVWYQIKFFFMYMRRFLSTLFLIIIAPLITITYSIDKMGDNKAQAVSVWIKEMLVNIFIQPLHIVIYMVFIASAGEIAKAAPIVAIILFGALTRAEKIVKNIFDMRGLSSIHSVGESLKKGK